MIEDHHFKWPLEPFCISLYLGLNPHPLCSLVIVLPTRTLWQILVYAFIFFQSMLNSCMFPIESTQILMRCDRRLRQKQTERLDQTKASPPDQSTSECTPQMVNSRLYMKECVRCNLESSKTLLFPESFISVCSWINLH